MHPNWSRISSINIIKGIAFSMAFFQNKKNCWFHWIVFQRPTDFNQQLDQKNRLEKNKNFHVSLLKLQGMISKKSLPFPITIVPCLCKRCFFVSRMIDRFYRFFLQAANAISFMTFTQTPLRLTFLKVSKICKWLASALLKYPLPRHFSRSLAFSQGGICQEDHVKLVFFHGFSPKFDVVACKHQTL